MTINNSSLAVDTPVSSSAAQNTQNPPDPTDSLASENTFLKLLVAQIQNQDPTSPTDPTQSSGNSRSTANSSS